MLRTALRHSGARLAALESGGGAGDLNLMPDMLAEPRGITLKLICCSRVIGRRESSIGAWQTLRFDLRRLPLGSILMADFVDTGLAVPAARLSSTAEPRQA